MEVKVPISHPIRNTFEEKLQSCTFVFVLLCALNFSPYSSTANALSRKFSQARLKTEIDRLGAM